MAYDEHRLGLKPVYRRWFYVCTFPGWVGRGKGGVGGPGGTCRGGWRCRPFIWGRGPKVGVRLVFLPPYSPELQPVGQPQG